MSVVIKEADNLVAGKIITDDRYPLASGQVLERGALLKIESKKMTSIADASEAVAVLVEDTDASNGDTRCGYIVQGELNQDGVVLGSFDADAVYEALLARGIVVKGGN